MSHERRDPSSRAVCLRLFSIVLSAVDVLLSHDGCVLYRFIPGTSMITWICRDDLHTEEKNTLLVNDLKL